jgi:DNA gyrase subunit A
MSKFTNDTLFADMNQNYIPMVDNYDSSLKEPLHLPAIFPMILNTGGQGIASGFASEIPPHRVDDICDITMRFIKNPDIAYKDLTKDFRPDFPVGGKIINEAELPAMYECGRGVIHVEATIEEGVVGKKECLIIRDLPYKVSSMNVMEQIQALTNPHPKTKEPGLLADKLAEVKDHADLNDPIRLVLIPKKDVSLSVLKNIILENTSLRSTVKYLPNVLSGNTLIENASLKDLIGGWLEFRISTLMRRFNYEIRTNSEDLALRKALLKAHSKLDEVIKIVKTAQSESDAVDKVVKLLKLTRREATYIVNIKLYQISKISAGKVQEDIERIGAKVNSLISLISSRDNILAYINDQLIALKKTYKSTRKCTLENTKTNDKFDVRNVIESEDLVIAISTDNYVYAKPASEVREYVNRGAKGSNFIDSKYKRVIRETFTANSHDDLLVFTKNGKVIDMKGYQFHMWHKPISSAIPDLGDQEVVAVIKVNLEEDREKFFTFVTANSYMKHVSAEEVASTERRMKGGKIVMRVAEDDALIGVALLADAEDRILITSNFGRAQNLAATDIATMLRPTSGAPKALLQDNEKIKCITVIPANQVPEATILVAASNGIGKLVNLVDVPARRGESGRRALMKIISFKGAAELLCGLLVNPESSLVATMSSNKTTKISASIVTKSGRNAQGTKLVTLGEGETLLDIAVVD